MEQATGVTQETALDVALEALIAVARDRTAPAIERVRAAEALGHFGMTGDLSRGAR